MKIQIIREEPPVTPITPIKSVIVEFTANEWHDLKVLANIPSSLVSEMMKKSLYTTSTENGCRTNDIYGLLRKIIDAK